MRLQKHQTKINAPIGASFIVLSSVFYASYGIWTKLMGNFFGGYAASAFRSILVLVILLPLAVIFRQLEPLRLKQNWRYIAGMTTASLFIWGPLYFAILHAGIGVSLATSYASFVIGSFFFGWLLAGERFTKDKAISAVTGIAGLILIFSPSVHKFGWAALFGALVSGLAASANMVFSKSIKYKATQSTLALWTASTIANFIMLFAVGEHIPSIGFHRQWLYLVIFAFISVASTWLEIAGLKLIEVGAAGILGLLEIVFGVLFGMVFFSERPGLIVLLGAVVIVAASTIPYVKDYNAQRGTLDSKPAN